MGGDLGGDPTQASPLRPGSGHSFADPTAGIRVAPLQRGDSPRNAPRPLPGSFP